jgi:hypothetical protein
MIRLLDEVCGQILFEIIAYIIILTIISILVDAGMSESQAELTVIISGICFLIIILLRWKKRRLALGKSVELDTDNDGYISEEEWAAAGMSNEDEN